MIRPTKPALLALTILLTMPGLFDTPAQAQATTSASCEPIRSRIEASIRSKGITDFRVTVADADAREPGRRVGDCEGGRKVILYVRGVTPDARAAAATPPAAPAVQRPAARADDAILTECADGTVQMGGTCKRR
jgi:hypothetical protein